MYPYGPYGYPPPRPWPAPWSYGYGPMIGVGAAPPPPLPETIVVTAKTNDQSEPVAAFDVEGIRQAFRSVTPTLLVVGILTGAAFALGGGLVSRLVFRER